MKALKSFRVYILHSKIIAYVPNIVVKDVLMQPDTEGKRGRWIAKILEFDIEIKPTKLIKGQGLARLMVDSNCKALNLSLTDNNIPQVDEKSCHILIFLSHIGTETLSTFCRILLALQKWRNSRKGN